MFQRSGLKSEKKKKIAVLGQKSVPSRRGGIEQVVTNMYPIITEHGYQVTCYNRRGECKENEYGEIIRERYYQGILLKTVPAIKKRGLSAVTSSFFAAVFSAVGKYDIVPAAVAVKAIPECNITYIDGEEMKEKLSGYLDSLYQQNPAAVGGALPADEFYFVP